MEQVRGIDPRLGELGNLPTLQGTTRWPALGLHLGVPQVTAIDPSLQHADSTTMVCSARMKGRRKRVSRRLGGFVLKQAGAGAEVETPSG
jgi:hypothetical protein